LKSTEKQKGNKEKQKTVYRSNSGSSGGERKLKPQLQVKPCSPSDRLTAAATE
jgi:hypothetical protein